MSAWFLKLAAFPLAVAHALDVAPCEPVRNKQLSIIGWKPPAN